MIIKGLLQKLVRAIKAKDMFGYTIQFNLGKHNTGNSHNTVIGGVFSIVIKSLFLSYVFVEFQTLINYERNQYVYTKSVMTREELGTLWLRETKFVPFLYIENEELAHAKSVEEYMKILNKHVKVSFKQKHYNYFHAPHE